WRATIHAVFCSSPESLALQKVQGRCRDHLNSRIEKYCYIREITVSRMTWIRSLKVWCAIIGLAALSLGFGSTPRVAMSRELRRGLWQLTSLLLGRLQGHSTS